MLFRGYRRVSIYKENYGDTPIDNHTKIMSSKSRRKFGGKFYDWEGKKL
jgi:hypothetical protein